MKISDVIPKEKDHRQAGGWVKDEAPKFKKKVFIVD